MAQSSGSGRVIGDYLVDRLIGSGSFSVVWHARHRVDGTEVAIKEIATGRLNEKLQESLMSEIFILQRIRHPNIIRLREIIEVSGNIHLVLEYCRGGDLSMYIQRYGRVPEETAKCFMQHLAKGLQILRDNNVIHRDLKPQNLLLSTSDERSVLKIADFGFARSLQPRGLAETLCGSPLYMAPEIMLLQKYDAKADLWSVGAILFQLVTGKTPFTGNTQTQLLQNIIKSNELHFPPESKDLSFDCKDLCQKLLRRNPVERLTFEEFFNHSFLSLKVPQGSSRSRKLSMSIVCYPPVSDPVMTEDSSRDECFPFILEDDRSGSCGSPSLSKRSMVEPSKGFTHEREVDKQEIAAHTYNKMDCPSTSRDSSAAPVNKAISGLDIHRPDLNQDGPLSSIYQLPVDQHSGVEDSLELIQDYVIVPGPSMDVSSHLTCISKPNDDKYQDPLQTSSNTMNPSSAVESIDVATNINTLRIGSFNCYGSASGTSLESMDLRDVFAKPSTHCMTRIKSLQQCASAIRELVNEKFTAGRHLEAFSIQFVILAVLKQALHVCHTHAASAMEGSLSHQEDPDSGEYLDHLRPEDISQIGGEFLREVESAENLAKFIGHESTEMPDAMETIFQSALALGRRGGVEEMMGNAGAAATYSKAAGLLIFLLVEAPSLILNPPFSLTNSDRNRLWNYIEILRGRQGYLGSDAGGSSVPQLMEKD